MQKQVFVSRYSLTIVFKCNARSEIPTNRFYNLCRCQPKKRLGSPEMECYPIAFHFRRAKSSLRLTPTEIVRPILGSYHFLWRGGPSIRDWWSSIISAPPQRTRKKQSFYNFSLLHAPFYTFLCSMLQDYHPFSSSILRPVPCFFVSNLAYFLTGFHVFTLVKGVSHAT